MDPDPPETLPVVVPAAVPAHLEGLVETGSSQNLSQILR